MWKFLIRVLICCSVFLHHTSIISRFARPLAKQATFSLPLMLTWHGTHMKPTDLSWQNWAIKALHSNTMSWNTPLVLVIQAPTAVTEHPNMSLAFLKLPESESECTQLRLSGGYVVNRSITVLGIDMLTPSLKHVRDVIYYYTGLSLHCAHLMVGT